MQSEFIFRYTLLITGQIQIALRDIKTLILYNVIKEINKYVLQTYA